MWKPGVLYILPCNIESDLCVNHKRRICYKKYLPGSLKETLEKRSVNHHIYVTSTFDLNVGDWFIFENEVFQLVNLVEGDCCFQIKTVGNMRSFVDSSRMGKRIIASTDPRLNLPVISERAILELCDGESISLKRNVNIIFDEDIKNFTISPGKNSIILQQEERVFKFDEIPFNTIRTLYHHLEEEHCKCNLQFMEEMIELKRFLSGCGED